MCVVCIKREEKLVEQMNSIDFFHADKLLIKILTRAISARSECKTSEFTKQQLNIGLFFYTPK